MGRLMRKGIWDTMGDFSRIRLRFLGKSWWDIMRLYEESLVGLGKEILGNGNRFGMGMAYGA